MIDIAQGSWSKGITPIAHIPMQDRPAFKMAIHQHEDRWYLYCAHFWHSGLTIVEITDPSHPRFIKFIEGPPNTWTLQVQIAEGRMITSLERIPPGWGGDPDGSYGEGFWVWDLSDPENPKKLGEYPTGGQGTHRNYYDGGRYVHATSWPQGFDGHIYEVVDIADPTRPTRVSRWWRPGQWLAGGEPGVPFGTLLHGGAYIQGNRAYLPYSAGGFVILDITDITQPQLISDLPFSPPFQAFIAVHTAVPLVNKPLVIVNSEAIAEQGDEALGYAGIVDISDERKPRLISLFPQPIPDPAMGIKNFYELPGRFGPHNQHQPQFQKVLWQNEDLVFLTYFNAGLRVYDISDPRTPKEIAYFIPPAPTQRLGPLPQTGLVTQTEDVLVDARGNIFISDKNRGVCVLRLQS
jgi:hypothetical protein